MPSASERESQRIAAVVLAGGEGRRMGGRKPLQPWAGGTLVAHALALARGWSPLTAVAVRDRAQVGDALDAPLILDDPDLGGPIAGLASALAFAAREDAELLLTLPCDAPFLPADLLARLRAALDGTCEAAVAASGGTLHPTCALWRTRAAGRLAGYLATGRRSLRGFAEACGMAVAEWDTSGGDPFANANTPEELAALRGRRAT